MDSYFLIITIIDTFVLGIMCVLTQYNETLNLRQRRWFISSFVLIIFISILEVVTVVVDNRPASLRWVNIIANYLGFGLTPAVPLFLSFALEKNRSAKPAILMEALYLLFLAMSFPFRLVFYVDQNNQYTREEFFGIYILAYCAGIFFLLVSTVRVVRKYQNRSKNSVYLIVAFLIACTMLQVIFPQIHVAWLCASLLSILYFTYCNGMWQQLDGLTGLLNQSSYLNKTVSLAKNTTLIVFDVDDFKQINDNYGHLVGDQCLKEIADCMKKAYSKDGLCYRIGGDEFCVLLDADADTESCNERLRKELESRRQTLTILPYVSVGSAPFTVGDNILTVKERADSTMYQMKREHKSRQTAQ
ncbi:MAG: GGDEF domain-containing protein [Bacillota bacterium]|nr:GGDEF domain-containing protein [Bacillota bacterium]